MKTKVNLSLIFSLLALAVAVAFFISGTNKQTQEPAATPPPVVSGNGVTIAYINADTIMNNYLLVEELMQTLTDKGSTMEKDLQKKQSQYEADASYFQEQVQKGALSEASAQEIYSKLMQKEQELYQLREQYSQQMMQMETEMNKKLLDKISDFLNQNNNFSYDYILNYTYNGDILLTNPKYDITSFVIDGLNKQYLSEK